MSLDDTDNTVPAGEFDDDAVAVADTAENLDFPDVEERPCWRVYTKSCGPERKRPRGVWYHHLTKPDRFDPDGVRHPVDDWVCGPLFVLATTRDNDDQSYGLMIEFINKQGNRRQWNMPSRLLASGSQGADGLLGELLDLGLKVKFNLQKKIAEYISDQSPRKTMWAATQLGWYNNAFVMPDRAIGGNNDIYFQSNSASATEFTRRGTLEEWRKHISLRCVGNPLLAFHVSSAFTGALLTPCDMEGIGFHVFGGSSAGKSTGAKLAASVWGDHKKYRRRWKASIAGLEAMAVKFNHGLLWLDEQNDGDPKEISEMLYTLVDGTGKQTAKKDRSAKAVATWTTSILSNGEKSTDVFLQRFGIQVQPGQLMRLLQIPIFGEYGCFDNLHGFPNGSDFSEHLQSISLKYHGTAGVAYLERLVADVAKGRNFHSELKKVLATLEADHKKLSKQERRALRSFSVNALGGELATEYGITGWPPGTAMEAAAMAFRQWRDYRGEGDSEGLQVLKMIRRYIETYGDSRFTGHLDPTRLTGERSGYWRPVEMDGREWLFSASGLQKACPGFEINQIKAALSDAGWLKEGKKHVQQQVKGLGWFYVIAIGDDNDEANEDAVS